MKFRKIVWLLAIVLLLTGCGSEKDKVSLEDASKPTDIVINTEKQEDEQEDIANQQQEDQDASEEDDLDKSDKENADIDNDSKDGFYDALLSKAYNLMVNSPEALLNEEGLSGIYDLANHGSTEEALSSIGYIIEDVSGDGVSELLIGHVPNGNDGSMVIALFTQTNGQPKLVFEGYYRNRYDWMGDGRFYYFGSGGAMYSMFATYRLEGTNLVCDDYYFSHEKNDSFEEIGYYHNTSGEWDVSVSKEISEEDFWNMESAWSQQVKAVEWNTFAEYGAK